MELAVQPGAASPEQQAVLEQLINYGASKVPPVTVTIVEVS